LLYWISISGVDFCLVPDFRENDFNFSLFIRVVTMTSSYAAFIKLSYILSIPDFFRDFIRKDIELCERIFLHLFRKSFNIFVVDYVYVLHYIHWLVYVPTILVSLEWNLINHVQTY
jgi:hypothetical protein